MWIFILNSVNIRPFNTLSFHQGKHGTIDHFTRCKQHWSRSTSCFSFL